MFGKLFRWLFGTFHSPGNIDQLYFEVNPRTGKKEWFKQTRLDCSICGAPGFECDSITNCRYSH